MKPTQKADQFTVFESSSCCSHKFLPNKIEKIGWLDVRGSIREVYIGWVAGDVKIPFSVIIMQFTESF